MFNQARPENWTLSVTLIYSQTIVLTSYYVPFSATGNIDWKCERMIQTWCNLWSPRAENKEDVWHSKHSSRKKYGCHHSMLEVSLDLSTVEEENTGGVEQGFIYQVASVLGPKE